MASPVFHFMKTQREYEKYRSITSLWGDRAILDEIHYQTAKDGDATGAAKFAEYDAKATQPQATTEAATQPEPEQQ